MRCSDEMSTISAKEVAKAEMLEEIG
jgi:hypothetical protein